MKQMTLGSTGLEKHAKATRRARFLAEMDRVVPWQPLCALIEPVYSKGTSGRPPVALERVLRIYFLQQWFNLSDPAAEEVLYDSVAVRQFVGIDLGPEPAPDETTILRFRITAPPSTKNAEKTRDPEMKPTRKNRQWFFGMKAPVGVDSKTKLIHAVAATAANAADSSLLPALLHGQETRLWGDQAYRGKRDAIRARAPRAQDFVNRRCRQGRMINEVERRKNQAKSRVHAKVEHAIGVIKRIFGLAKVRCSGPAKIAHRLFVTAALVNLYMARSYLLRRQRESCA